MSIAHVKFRETSPCKFYPQVYKIDEFHFPLATQTFSFHLGTHNIFTASRLHVRGRQIQNVSSWWGLYDGVNFSTDKLYLGIIFHKFSQIKRTISEAHQQQATQLKAKQRMTIQTPIMIEFSATKKLIYNINKCWHIPNQLLSW